MSCKAAKLDQDSGRYDCEVSGSQCIYLIPSSKACAEEYGEGPDAVSNKEPRFRLDEDSVCYGCDYFVSEWEIGVPVPEEDLNCGGICDCNEDCIEGSMNGYRV